jgi:hypothetical protein
MLEGKHPLSAVFVFAQNYAILVSEIVRIFFGLAWTATEMTESFNGANGIWECQVSGSFSQKKWLMRRCGTVGIDATLRRIALFRSQNFQT